MTPRARFSSYLFFWFGYVCLVAVVPVLLPPDPTLPNVAARSGYNTDVAYLVIAAWSVAGLVFFTLAGRLGWLQPVTDPDAARSSPAPPSLLRGWLPCLAVGLLASLLYWPAFLARYGTYIEDSYFLTVLLRMQCGQLPYRDFEFLYGPLMIYPAHYWMNLWGFSMHSYFALLAFLQGAFFAIALRLFQRHVPNVRERYLAFLVFVPFVLDTLTGLNYIGWRVLPAVLAMVMVASRPHKTGASLTAAILTGLQLTYSYEYGAIAMIAVLLMYAAVFAGDRKTAVALPAVVFAVGSLATGMVVTLLLTGESFSDYISATARTLAYAQQTGMGNFRFYWTLNSLALFGLLSVAVAVIGTGLAHIRRIPMNHNDRLLLVSTLFALGSLKIAIQRADIWHITLPFIPLLLALLWRSPRQLFVIGRFTQRAIWLLILVAATTRTIGLMPTGSAMVAGLLRGAQDVLQGKPAEGTVNTRTYCLQSERTHHDPDHVELGELLNSPPLKNRPVVFYGGVWWLGIRAGVCPGGYASYDVMYADSYRPLRDYVHANRDALVVMDVSTYQQLYENALPEAQVAETSMTKRLASWLSSIHYQQKQAEKEIKFELWKQNLGAFLIMNHRPLYRTEKFVVLEQAAGTSPGALPGK